MSYRSRGCLSVDQLIILQAEISVQFCSQRDVLLHQDQQKRHAGKRNRDIPRESERVNL
jgi:hypothetical protein